VAGILPGGIAVALVPAITRASGFGFYLMATPFVFVSAVSLPLVITVNLLTPLAARVAVCPPLPAPPVMAAQLAADGCAQPGRAQRD
jgi:hypothetical protein